MNRRAASAAIGILLVTTAPGCSRGSGTSGAGDEAASSPFVAVDPGSASPTDKAIARAQERLRANVDNDSARLALAQAFLQKAREVGDPTLYVKAGTLLDEAGKGRKDDAGVLIAQGALALAQHRFEDALELGRRAVKAAPGNASALGVVVDALNELGRYDEALEATQAMVDAKPNLASLSRASYARELRGDLDGAIVAMTQAATAGAGSGENVAFVEVQLGNLLLTSGDVAGAEASYAAADRSFPGYALAKAGRARALVARGEPAAAAEVLADVVRVLPTAEHAIAHGDALAAAGRKAEATEAYALVDVIARLYRANGVNVDLELALFEADSSPGAEAVEQARRAAKERPSIQGHDALAWALFTAGKVDEAWPEARRALATGSRDPLLRFHAAAIAEARGQRDVAARHLRVVLDTNPRFSAVLAAKVASLAAKHGLQVPPPPASPPPPA
ncbi:MAG: tetratricopeptide repeat protein [Actinomycetota bacterium]|nr:tetratricopeptide repeat protein [Actinomycetota bacterium]